MANAIVPWPGPVPLPGASNVIIVGRGQTKGVLLKFRTPPFVPPEPLGATIPSSNIEVIPAVSSRARFVVLFLSSVSEVIFFFLLVIGFPFTNRFRIACCTNSEFFSRLAFLLAVLIESADVKTLAGNESRQSDFLPSTHWSAVLASGR